ncbi:MAG: hypothetical protein ACOYOS_19275 [Syntrophales bacterium]
MAHIEVNQALGCKKMIIAILLRRFMARVRAEQEDVCAGQKGEDGCLFNTPPLYLGTPSKGCVAGIAAATCSANA